MRLTCFALCFLLSFNLPIVFANSLKSDESVLFIPSIAYEVEGNKIAVNIEAWVYEKERRLGMTTLLAEFLGIDKNTLSVSEYERLYQRSQLFRVDSERGKIITVQLPDKTTYTLTETNKGGRTSKLIYSAPSNFVDNQLTYQLYESGIPAESNLGKVFFATSEGISVISDIDDTIKNSNVLDKNQLLINTFIKEFEPVTNMRDWYQYIANNGQQHIAFHYVSSSPIQLYPALKAFMDEANFPQGSFHLREGTTWHSLVAVGEDSPQHKKTNIEKLLNAYPKRQFVLIGDSGEADPEIYADMMRRYPKQIRCIAIRDVTNQDNHNERYQQIFAELDGNKWRVFTDPSNLKGWCFNF